jgi:hypothetical protein
MTSDQGWHLLVRLGEIDGFSVLQPTSHGVLDPPYFLLLLNIRGGELYILKQ